MKVALLLLVVLLVPAGFIGYLYLSQDDLIYPRTVNEVPPPGAGSASFEAIRLATPDGVELAGIVFPPYGPADAAGRRPRWCLPSAATPTTWWDLPAS
ncbi:MAG: hypothetical protein HC900_07785 [Methylacidiphilales bacterium]|nr:hypothetical protein [Candidatus Methylacidiphilales bacterium]